MLNAMKRTTVILLCLVMALLLSVGAFAEETGSITVNYAIDGKDYRIYRLFDLESYNAEREAYVYKLNDQWRAFANQTGIKGVYIDVNSQEYVSWVKNADEVAFAKLAKAYAEEHGITADDIKTAENEKVVFSELPLGYYLIDSPIGALCGLNTTNPNISIDEKNAQPTILKEVESAAGSTVFGGENHATIGDTISFRIAVTAQPGAENYVIHDKMDAGLTFKSVSKITRRNADSTTPTEVASTNYTVKTTGINDCTFEISFTDEFLESIVEETKLNIYFTAELNENAVYAGEGANENDSWLSYGDNSVTTHSKTKTYTYLFELVKTNANKTLIEGAKFELYDSTGRKINLTKDPDQENTYRVATPEQSAADDFKSAVIQAGDAYIIGLSAGSYALREIDPPAGYNRLEKDFTFVLRNKDEEAVWNDLAQTSYISGGINVINQKGSMLPQTGGVGTKVFFVTGGLLLACAGVLLITKKRMRNESR